jgi:hypothetical protein
VTLIKTLQRERTNMVFSVYSPEVSLSTFYLGKGLGLKSVKLGQGDICQCLLEEEEKGRGRKKRKCERLARKEER